MTEPQVDARARIDDWVVGMDERVIRLMPIGCRELMRRFVESVRAALAAYDEDHHEITFTGPSGFPLNKACKCRGGLPCPIKSHHEAALWKTISGEQS